MSELWNDRERVSGQLGRKAQVLITISGEIIAAMQQRAQLRAQQLQYEAQQRDKAAANRLLAQHRADEPFLTKAISRRFWNSNPDVEEIGEVFEIASSWAVENDPAGKRAMTRIRRELKERYGVEIENPTTSGSEVAEILAAAATPPIERSRQELKRQQEAAEDRGDDPALVVQAALIRNELTDTWWESAPDEEIAAVLEQVSDWDDERITRELRDWIRQSGQEALSTERFERLFAYFPPTTPQATPETRSAEPSSEAGVEFDAEQIRRQDEQNDTDLGLRNDEFQEQVQAAGAFSRGNPPTSQLNRKAPKLGKLGLRKRGQGRGLRRDNASEVER